MRDWIEGIIGAVCLFVGMGGIMFIMWAAMS